jgi:tripartite-type tricarboxylate transporter receptor subunit TctC
MQFTLLSPLFAVPQYKAGNIGVLAVIAPERIPFFPDAPAVSEVGHPDLVVEALNGFIAPVGTSNDIVQKLNQQIGVALRDPKVGSKFAKMYTEVVFGTPEDYAATNLAEISRWKEVVRKAGLQLQ